MGAPVSDRINTIRAKIVRSRILLANLLNDERIDLDGLLTVAVQKPNRPGRRIGEVVVIAGQMIDLAAPQHER